MTVREAAPTRASDPSLGPQLRGLALSVGVTGQFSARAFVGTQVTTRLDGGRQDVGSLAELADGVPIITDSPARAEDLLGRIGRRAPPTWDILELAALLVPASPRDALDRAADFFGIVVEGSGLTRQVQCVLMLFELLVTMLDQVDTHSLLRVVRLSNGLDWPLRTLFSTLQQARAISPLEAGPLAAAAPIGGWITQGAPASTRRRRTEAAEAHSPPPQPAPIDADEVVRRLAPDGALAAVLPGYESRREQGVMAQLVADALNTSSQLLVEAGTGTGKSLAYLLPVAMRAVTNQQRVVISTATTTLQDQLYEHDVPLVQSSGGSAPPPRAAVLKGRTNYLCLRRWQLLLQAGDLSAADRMLLIKTLFWLPRTTSGDRAELHLSPAEEEAWQRVCAVAEACTPVRCQYHRIGVCFLARARRKAEDSHIVIANHALLLSDLVSRSRVLPDYDILVVDEAHHLEDEATQQLGWRLGERELQGRLERLWSVGLAGGGAIPEALALIAAGNGARLPVELRPTLERGEYAVARLGSAVTRLYDGLLRLLEDPDLLAASGGDDSSLRITPAIRAGSGWQELEQTWAEAALLAQQIEPTIVEVTAELEALPEASDVAHDLSSELSGHLDYWRDVRRRLNACIHEPGKSAVHWISGGGRFRSAWLNAAPIEVGGLLRDRLFAGPEASILVSATLSIGDSFDYVKRRLGLGDAAAHALGSPFDYARAALLYVPNDLPDPNQPGYQPQLERTILDVVTRLHGRTLVLFTSRAHLKATYHALRDQLVHQGITLLAQGIDETSRTRLLDSFRRGSRVVLFGTNAFWEGIDVVGEALSCVMVTRLPFAVPTDPVYAARAEQFDNPFAEYAVPQAVLRLKQGFGRLIRSRTDRGVVVVLDRRLVTRFYGQVFLRSLPPCAVKQGPSARAGHEAANWLLAPDLEQQQLALA
ncbi:MAG: DEAD/DEAH box helicase [Chloroflexi bacterium]|nr:DEAD/DEAH box helicase [Chloroflexota bacterium]